jgi:hypothetical protein
MELKGSINAMTAPIKVCKPLKEKTISYARRKRPELLMVRDNLLDEGPMR